MKRILLLVSILLLSIQMSYAYTIDEVSEHNTQEDCWVIFENKVYDLTKYVSNHDVYLNIRSWCGQDITQDFKTKADTGRDHKTSSYYLLEEYLIGEVSITQDQLPVTDTSIIQSESEVDSSDIKHSQPYNVVIPLLMGISLYWIPYFLIKKKVISLPFKKFNAFWNTILLFLLLVPAFGFGVIMILRYTTPSLWNLKLDIMYWHVELSLLMGILAINHFLQRISIYFLQLK